MIGIQTDIFHLKNGNENVLRKQSEMRHIQIDELFIDKSVFPFAIKDGVVRSQLVYPAPERSPVTVSSIFGCSTKEEK